jgi:prevent-host-death family protein
MAIEYESISELKSHLPQAVDDPFGEIIITKTGKPQAVLLGIANYQALLAMAQLAKMPTLLASALAEHRRFQEGTNEGAIGLDELDTVVQGRLEETTPSKGR